MTLAPGRIDAHHHFWDPARYTYPWMAGEAMNPVRRAYTPTDLAPELKSADVIGTVLVQTVSDLAETREFLDIAARTDFVKGVVGWVDLTSPAVGDVLDELLAGPTGSRLVGIRHQVHDEPDPRWLCRDDVRRGLAAVQSRQLTYDLLVRARELPAATETVAALPDLQFVLDHIAKPRIADAHDHDHDHDHDDPWHAHMPQLAALPNVTAKLSGLVTEADWAHWTAADLRPFVQRVLAWFGTDRIMFGSDWPVCLLAASYHAASAALAEALGPLSAPESVLLYRDNALTSYRLNPR